MTTPLRPATATPLPGLFADPNLAIFNGRYYLYPTTDGSPGWSSNSFSVLSSKDLIEWEDHGAILRLGDDVAWADAHAWAPAIAERDGRYYFYFTARNSIGLAVGDSPTGPFRDIGEPLVREGDYAGAMIDPSVFVDDDGRYFLYWGNTWLHCVELDAGMRTVRREDVVSWQPTGFREAGWVHRRGDVYYLSWSENDTRDPEYRVRYATGLSPVGPWTDRGVLLEQRPEHGILATGHHSITRISPADEWIIAYHRFRIPGGNGHTRETVFEVLEHDDDGGLRVLDAVEPLRRPL